MSIEIINSQKFSNISDFVYSEIVTIEDFKIKNKLNNLTIIQQIDSDKANFVWYVANSFEIHDNDVIFCQTQLVESFFELISNNKKIKNLILITNQSDNEINEDLYYKKPKSIKKWFSTNVNFESSDLVAIPLGINNSYIKNFLVEKDFKNFSFQHFKDKKDIMYNNYNLNTKPFHRLNTARIFSKFKNSILIKADKTKYEYIEDLNNYRYIICPWGNGYDSHRIWEAIYSGSIAITKRTKSFESFEGLPLIVLNNFSEAKNLSVDYEESLFNISKADFKYWKNMIYEEKVIDKNEKHYFNSEKIISEFLQNKKSEDVDTAKFKKRRRNLFRYTKFTIKAFSNKKLIKIL